MPTTTRATVDYAEGRRRLAYVTTVTCSDCGHADEIQHETRGVPRVPSAEDSFRWHTGNGRYLNRCRSCERAHVRRWRESRRVPATTAEYVASLGVNRRYGVELELMFPSGTSAATIDDAIRAAGIRGWRVKADGSLVGAGMRGFEVVSPPLSGEHGFDDVRTVCTVLQGLGAKPNRSCGLHVHHEVSDLGLDDFKRLAASWTNNQSVIDLLVSESRRGGRNHYCGRITPRDRENLNRLTTLGDITHAFSTRYRTLNLACYGRYGTVEVRQHQGTVEADKIIAWIRFGQEIVESSRTAVVERSTSVRTLLDRLGGLAEDTREFLTRRADQLAGRATVAA